MTGAKSRNFRVIRSHRQSTRRGVVQRFLPHRSVADWGRRLALAGVAVVLGWFSLASTFGTIAVKSNPELAHVLAPWDGMVTAALAEHRFALAPNSEADADPSRLAKLALTQDPAATDALSVLGLQAQLQGDAQQARRVFAYSLRLSRRELQPRLWAIEEAVGRGDIAGALRHYDIALRTSKTAPGLLFPVLTRALTEPRVRTRLIVFLSRAPVWSQGFVAFAARNAPDPMMAARFLTEAGQAGLPIADDDRAAVVDALAARDQHEQAWEFYSSFRRGTDRRRSRDPRFSMAAAGSRATFDWTLPDEPGVSASFQHVGADIGILDYAVARSVGGSVAQQTQVLTPGRYRLQGRSANIAQIDAMRPFWILTCVDGRILGRIQIPDSSTNQGSFAGTFTVPSDCAAQTLAFVARPSEALSGSSGQILEAALFPLPQG